MDTSHNCVNCLRLTSALGVAMEIIRKILKQCSLVPVDHACIECIPDGSSVVEGFLCGVHEGVKALSDPTGQQAFERWKKMEVICKKSVGWWLGKRPTNYTKQMHLENPDINCPTKSEQKLAKAVAEFEALDAKGEGK